MMRARRFAIALALLAAISAAGADSPDPESMRNAEDAEISEGIKLQFHEEGPTFGESRKPSFWLEAARGVRRGDSQFYVEEAVGVINRDPGEDLRLRAASGFFDGENGTAVLRDGVHANSGKWIADFQNLNWDNEKSIARSDAHSEFTDGINELHGNAIEIHPKEDRVELFDGSGKILIAAAAPGDKPESEEDEVRFESLDISFKGSLHYNLETGELSEVSDGVVLTIFGVKPEDNLKVTAEKVTFSYANPEDRQPTTIHLSGRVNLEHSNGIGKADEVNVNFETGEVEFKGNAELTGALMKRATASVITINLYTKDVVLGPGGRIEEVQLKSDDETPDQEPADERP